jgi:CheY-like chemotaxis protein
MQNQILLVEDNAKVREQLTQVLSSAGYHVSVAVNGLDGYDKALNNPFNLVIVDHLMPLMDGLQLIKNLKSNQATTHLPVILLSTQNTKPLAQLQQSLSFQRLLAKPVNEQEVVSQVAELVQQNMVA